MIRVSTINKIAISILICSCCKMQHEQGSVKPEWYADIPTFESPEIFYDGLPNIPQCGDLLIAHTTIRDDGFMAEDNRLCAININTREASWYFPGNLEEKHYAHFD